MHQKITELHIFKSNTSLKYNGDLNLIKSKLLAELETIFSPDIKYVEVTKLVQFYIQQIIENHKKDTIIITWLVFQ